ncbi:Psort location [Vermiconidia calcicola]|uniref:Psort location n=1 Tax=Vermiconidia calcicola TaxID=1690605 RepID=A0ACC3NJR1_9PEZI|nr:Psort location [Vermiconidia calcicola]
MNSGPHVSTKPVVAVLITHASSYNTNDQIGADVEYGTFRNPSSYIRRRFRQLDGRVNVSVADPYANQLVAATSNNTHQLTILQPSNKISNRLRHVSGRGFYTTTFSLAPNRGPADGTMLALGVLVNTARAWVNGHQLPPLDPMAAIADIGDYLVDGENQVEVVVTTTLSNALIPIHQNLQTSGTLWLGEEPVQQEYGLVTPVSIVPYRTTVIEL